MGLGWLRLTPNQLYSLTLRQFFNAIEGYNEVRRADTDFHYQTQMEAARYTAVMVLTKFAGKEFDASFPWDKPRPIKLMSPERFDELKRTWKIK